MKTIPQLGAVKDAIVTIKLDQSSFDAAVGLFTLPKLRSLALYHVPLDSSFYAGIANVAPYSQVMNSSTEIINLYLDFQQSQSIAFNPFHILRTLITKIYRYIILAGFLACILFPSSLL